MEKLERIGVSLENDLLAEFDKLIGVQGYQNRSEAIRDLIREKLSSRRLEDPKARAFAAVCLVYDHHSTRVMHALTSLQHSHLLQTICTMHIHLDRHDCMEIVVLKGPVGEINRMAENMLSQKGVKLGKVNLIAPLPDKGHS